MYLLLFKTEYYKMLTQIIRTKQCFNSINIYVYLLILTKITSTKICFFYDYSKY